VFYSIYDYNINFIYLFSHKVYMRIQEEMVKMLNEQSWEDVRLNCPDASSSTTLSQFFVAFKKLC
jgi:hypothetical protein